MKNNFRKIISALLLAILFTVQPAIISYANPAVTVEATQTKATIIVNGSSWHTLTAFNINGFNYVRLRDAAEMLDGTASQFNVVWRWIGAGQNEILTDTPYVYSETSKPEYPWWNARTRATPMTASLLVDGKPHEFPCYNIGGHNYFQLADLASVLNFYINWRAEDNTNYITTYASDNTVRVWRPDFKNNMNQMNTSVSSSNSGSISNSYIFTNGSNIQTLTVTAQYDSNTQQTDSKITLDTYTADFTRTDSKNIAFEGEKFGTFYAGEHYNYIAFGNDNMEEDNTQEVIRIVKYDKNFNRIGAVSVRDCYTVQPFRSAQPDMAEYGDTLVLHTSRLRYLSNDGLRHQSQLTVIMNTQTMHIINSDDLGSFQNNHVSHSFNQFVRFDSNNHVLIDHGDAYPRSIVLNKYSQEQRSNYEEVDLLNIPGETGNNYTGVTVGGFEITRSRYIVAVNSVDFNSSTRERDLLILTVPKDTLKQEAVTVSKITDYSENNKLASKPYLVKTDENEVIVLWQEFADADSYYSYSTGVVKWMKIGGDGHTGIINTVKNITLSADCQPIYKDGKIIWYVDDPLYRLFFNIDVN